MEKSIKLKENINIFWHICTIGKWRNIVADQLLTLRSSGLIDCCNKINVTILGDDFDLDIFEGEQKIEIRNKNENINLYESVCLNDLRDWCNYNQSKVLYIHSKGVSRKDKVYQNVWEWRKMMEYFLIENWQKCVRSLDDYDTVGCNISYCGFGKHYSGNFWWSKSSYLSSLEEIKISNEELWFWRCESWLMLGNPRSLEIYRDEQTQHYYENAPKDYR